MEIRKNLENKKYHKTAVAVGKFDGVHNGHRLIFDKLQRKKQEGMTTVVFTFTKTPRILVEHREAKYIFTEQEKYRFYEEMGMDVLIEYEIDQHFLDLEPEEFVKKLLVDRLDMRYICAGSDFRFGKDRKGDVSLLEKLGERYGFETEVIPKRQDQCQDISSTWIRQLITQGQMEEANRLMGHPYCIYGEVAYGNQLGRTVGMPTINQVPEKDKILPPKGVYASRIRMDGGEWYGITNVGYKPTVTSAHELGVETYIFDFSQEVYGKLAAVEFLSFIRPEQKFPSLEAVKEQVEKDIGACRRFTDGQRICPERYGGSTSEHN